MSGHSKWSKIKHKKGTTDQKRGTLFSKLLAAVAIAARENADPQANPRLRAAIDRAKHSQVPTQNIERVIKKLSETENLEEIVVEAYGPEKSALIIEGITDNKNRTIAELKKLLSDHDAKLADPGSVLWAFARAGDSWTPQFIQPLSPEAQESFTKLIKICEEHPDIQTIYTNVQ